MNDVMFGHMRPQTAFKDVTGAQAETAFVNAPGATKKHILLTVAVSVTVAEAGKQVAIKEADGNQWVTVPLDTVGVYFLHWPNGLRWSAENKAINWISTSTGTGKAKITITYATQPND